MKLAQFAFAAIFCSLSCFQSSVASALEVEMTAEEQQSVFSELGIQENIMAQQAFFEQMHATKIHHGGCISQKGRASWYGPGFAGHLTASGEVFHPEKDLTAASLTIPLGTKVRVTNLATKKSLVVTVNDRGPYVPGRILDLSLRAAKVLNIVQTGTGNVKIESCFSGAN